MRVAIPLPLVIKGATGASGMRVRIVSTDAELARAVDDARRAGGEWVAQEFIPSPTYLVGGVFHRGEPLRLYAAEKLEQHPPRTGPAIRLRSTGDDYAALLESAVRAIRELRWTGSRERGPHAAPDGRYVLLEINPRPWGSIASALDAGVDLFTPFADLICRRASLRRPGVRPESRLPHLPAVPARRSVSQPRRDRPGPSRPVRGAGPRVAPPSVRPPQPPAALRGPRAVARVFQGQTPLAQLRRTTCPGNLWMWCLTPFSCPGDRRVPSLEHASNRCPGGAHLHPRVPARRSR